MLSKDSYGSLDEGPKYKAELFSIRLPSLFNVKVIERLLHRLSKSIPEFVD